MKQQMIRIQLTLIMALFFCSGLFAQLAVSANVTSNYNGYDVSCGTFANGEATATASGGSAPYTYLWSNSSTTAIASGLATGCYAVTVTDAIGSTATNSICLTAPPTLFGTITASAMAICDGDPVTISSSVGGGVPPLTYQWSSNLAPVPGATGPTYIATSSALYTLEITDANGCVTLSQSISILSGTAPNLSITPTTQTVCTGDDVTFTASVIPVGSAFNWSTGETTSGITTNIEGKYYLVVTDTAGCEALDSVQLNNYPQSTAQITSSGPTSFCAGNSVVLYANNTGGGPFIIEWYTANTGNYLGNTDSIMVAQSESIYYHLVDIYGCEVYSDTVGTSALPFNSVNISSSHPPAPVCASDTVTLTASATGATAYQWSDGSTTSSIEVYASGMYEVTASFPNGCISTESINIVYNPALSVTASVTSNYNGADISCNGAADGEITATVVGGTAPYNYLWPTAYAGNGSAFAVHTGLVAGTYDVTITDANGCTATTASSTTLTEPSAVTATISSSVNLVCGTACTGEATVVASGGTGAYIYNWSGGQTTPVAAGLCQGMNTVTVTDVNACTDLEVVPVNSISVDVSLSPSTYSGFNTSCFGTNDGDINTIVSGGSSPFSYIWSNAQTTTLATGLSAGIYSVTVTDANGCTDTASVSLIEPPLVVVNATGAVDPSCNGVADGSFTATVSGGVGGYVYQWNDANTQITSTAVNLPAGNYCVTATDVNGCTASDCGSIFDSALLGLSIDSVHHVSCNGAADGAVYFTPSGGTAPYTYSLDGSVFTAAPFIANNLTAGTYTVVIQDNNGCVTAGTAVSVTEPNQLIVTIDSVHDVSCHGGSDGALIFSASLGTAPYTFDIGGGPQVNGTFSNLAANNYTVSATDNNGCTDTMTVSLIEPAVLLVSLTGINPTCIGGDGDATAVVSGGVPAYSYAWSVGVTTATISDQSPGIGAGMYEVTITDANACVVVDTVYLSDPTAIAGIDTILFVSPDSTLDFCVPYASTAVNATVVSILSNGTIVNNGGGCFSYTPTNFAENTDTIIVQVCDTNGTYEHEVVAYIAGCVWAGDTDTNQVANNFDLLPIGTNYGLTGMSRPNADLNWDCEPMYDWSLVPTGNPDPKHSDTNGDGIIDDNDTLAITLNWGQVYVKNGSPTTANGTPIYVDTTSAAPGQTLLIPVVLGTNLLPANNAYGVAFTLTYDNTIVDTNSVSMDYSNSWLGIDGLDMITIEKDFYAQGEIQVGMSRIDQLVVSGSGAVAYIQLTIKDDVLKSSLLRLDFDVKDVKLIDNNGVVLPVAPEATSSVVIASSVNQYQQALNFELYPNPTNAALTVVLPGASQQGLRLYNSQGQLLQSWQADAGNQLQLDLQDYPAGAYLLQLLTADGVATKRVVVIR